MLVKVSDFAMLDWRNVRNGRFVLEVCGGVELEKVCME